MLLPDKKFNSTEQIYLIFPGGSALSLTAPTGFGTKSYPMDNVNRRLVPIQRNANIIVWRLATICRSYFTVYTYITNTVQLG